MSTFEKWFLTFLAAMFVSTNAWMAWHTPHWLAGSNTKQETHHYYKPGKANCDALLRSLRYLPPRRKNQSESQESDKGAHADLCQQIRMAKAAEDAANSSYIQSWINFFNLLAVLVTAGIAGLAARWAWRAADAAATMNERAESANKIAQQAVDDQIAAAELQSRAYLDIPGINVIIPDNRVQAPLSRGVPPKVLALEIEVHNHGQTPAHDCVVVLKIRLQEVLVGNDPINNRIFFESADLEVQFGWIAPNQTGTRTISVDYIIPGNPDQTIGRHEVYCLCDLSTRYNTELSKSRSNLPHRTISGISCNGSLASHRLRRFAARAEAT